MKMEIDVPISEILTLEVVDRLDAHGQLDMRVIIDDERQNEFFSTNFQGDNVSLFHLSIDETTLVFNGHITTLNYEFRADLIIATITAVTYSTFLDITPKRRTFQDINKTYDEIISSIVKESTGQVIFNTNAAKPTQRPFFQYEETDWQFIKRLASHLGVPLQINLYGEKPDCYIGIRGGRMQEINQRMIVEEGFGEAFFSSNGYRRGESQKEYVYLKVRHQDYWRLGDFTHYKGQKLTLTSMVGNFHQGEITFEYTFGGQGYLKREIIFSQTLKGLSLQGVIKETKKESAQIQLFIDELPEHDYYWPWVPEIGNMGYVMPEVGSRVVLTLTTKDEKDALATHLLRFNTTSLVFDATDFKQMHTVEDKLIGLYPEEVIVRVRNLESIISLADALGIALKTKQSVQMRAQGDVNITASTVNIQTPHELLMQTSQSNVKIEENFNIFAPGDVHSSSQRQYVPRDNVTDETENDEKNNQDSEGIGMLPQVALGIMAKKMAKSPEIFASYNDYSYNGGSKVPINEEENEKGGSQK